MMSFYKAELPTEPDGWEESTIREGLGGPDEHSDRFWRKGPYGIEQDSDGGFEAYVLVADTPFKVGDGFMSFEEAVNHLTSQMQEKKVDGGDEDSEEVSEEAAEDAEGEEVEKSLDGEIALGPEANSVGKSEDFKKIQHPVEMNQKTGNFRISPDDAESFDSATKDFVFQNMAPELVERNPASQFVVDRQLDRIEGRRANLDVNPEAKEFADVVSANMSSGYPDDNPSTDFVDRASIRQKDGSDLALHEYAKSMDGADTSEGTHKEITPPHPEDVNERHYIDNHALGSARLMSDSPSLEAFEKSVGGFRELMASKNPTWSSMYCDPGETVPFTKADESTTYEELDSFEKETKGYKNRSLKTPLTEENDAMSLSEGGWGTGQGPNRVVTGQQLNIAAPGETYRDQDAANQRNYNLQNKTPKGEVNPGKKNKTVRVSEQDEAESRERKTPEHKPPKNLVDEKTGKIKAKTDDPGSSKEKSQAENKDAKTNYRDSKGKKMTHQELSQEVSGIFADKRKQDPKVQLGEMDSHTGSRTKPGVSAEAVIGAFNDDLAKEIDRIEGERRKRIEGGAVDKFLEGYPKMQEGDDESKYDEARKKAVEQFLIKNRDALDKRIRMSDENRSALRDKMLPIFMEQASDRFPGTHIMPQWFGLPAKEVPQQKGETTVTRQNVDADLLNAKLKQEAELAKQKEQQRQEQYQAKKDEAHAIQQAAVARRQTDKDREQARRDRLAEENLNLISERDQRYKEALDAGFSEDEARAYAMYGGVRKSMGKEDALAETSFRDMLSFERSKRDSKKGIAVGTMAELKGAEMQGSHPIKELYRTVQMGEGKDWSLSSPYDPKVHKTDSESKKL